MSCNLFHCLLPSLSYTQKLQKFCRPSLSFIILFFATMKRLESNAGITIPNPMLHYKYITITLVMLIVSTLLVATFAIASNYKYVNGMAQLRAQNQHNSDLVRIKKFSCNTYLTSGYYIMGGYFAWMRYVDIWMHSQKLFTGPCNGIRFHQQYILFPCITLV